MREQRKRGSSALCRFFLTLFLFALGNMAIAKTPRTLSPQIGPSPGGIKIDRQDDSFSFKPASDLALRPESERQAGALAHFVEGMSFEENGEMDKALEAYRK